MWVVALLTIFSAILIFQVIRLQDEIRSLKGKESGLSKEFGEQLRSTNNPTWVEEEHVYSLSHPPVETADDDIERLTTNWNAYLDEHTPSIYNTGKPAIDCNDPKSISIPAGDLKERFESSGAVARARLALKECGFVFLDNLFERSMVEEFSKSYQQLRNGSDSHRYPCQGEKRHEVLLPFRPPFNSTEIYGDYRIRAIVKAFLNADYKLELMTVIDSPPGSGDQRYVLFSILNHF